MRYSPHTGWQELTSHNLAHGHIAGSYKIILPGYNLEYRVTDMSEMFYYAGSFNQNLAGWCVTQIPSMPTAFDVGANSWTLPDSRPIWGTCPE